MRLIKFSAIKQGLGTSLKRNNDNFSSADIAGLATTIMDVASKDLKLAVRSINYKPKGDGTATAQLCVEVSSVGVVDMLLHSLRRIKGIKNVYRMN